MQELDKPWYPAIDFNETEVNLILKVKLPGNK